MRSWGQTRSRPSAATMTTERWALTGQLGCRESAKGLDAGHVLTASSGLLPGTPADDELTLSDAWLEVFQEVLPRARYRAAGMLVAEAYRQNFGLEPPLLAD